MFALLLSFASLALATEPTAIVWPHETKVVSDSGHGGSIAVLVHCFPPKAKYRLDGQDVEVMALASAMASRVDKVVVLENPSAPEVREELANLVAEDGSRYEVGFLVAVGAGYGGDLGDPHLACRDWTHSVDTTGLPTGDAFPAAFAAAVAPHDQAETLTLAELESGMQALATENHAIFDAGVKMLLPDEDVTSIGPTASDWTLGLAISAGDSHAFTGRGFLPALTSAINQTIGKIKLGELTVATRQRVTDPTVTVVTHGDLSLTFFDSAPTVTAPDPTIQGQTHVGSARRPVVRPVVRWTGIGVGVAAFGASAYTYSKTQQIGPTLNDAAPDNYDTREDALQALAEYNAYRGLTYGLYAVGGVGLAVGGLTFVVGPGQATLSGSF